MVHLLKNNIPLSSIAVANEFLALSCTDNIPIDQRKLQGLLFYANAWFLGNFEKPLFSQTFEARPWGPVLQNVYMQTHKYGKSPIASFLSEITIDGFCVPFVSQEKEQNFIRSVWGSYRGLSGVQLCNSTHAEGEPWKIVYDAYDGDLRDAPDISHSLIYTVYRKKVLEQKKQASPRYAVTSLNMSIHKTKKPSNNH